MATVNSKVFEHHGKADGTWNVKISVCQKGITKYIDTEHFVSRNQLTKEYVVKDTFLKKILNKTLEDYRTKISELGEKIKLFNAQNLKDYLIGHGEDVEFLGFVKLYIDQLRIEAKKQDTKTKKGKNGKGKTADGFQTIRNSLIDFFKRDKVSITEINLDMLNSWEKFLRSTRTLTRNNQFGRPVTTISKPLTDAGIHNYMRDLRSLFNKAVKKYNDKSLGIIRIKHYPFEDYQIVKPPKTKKRNISIEKICEIVDYKARPGSRAELAQGCFLVSFLMCGINAIDLFYADPEDMVNGRLEYNRSKSKDRREDSAFISIKIVKEAKPILEKYIGKLRQRYATAGGLTTALDKGLKKICEDLKWKEVITFYWARHSFGTIARNKCGMNKADVGEAMNHVDKGHATTDIYIENDWSVVDKVQKAACVYYAKAIMAYYSKSKRAKNVRTKQRAESIPPVRQNTILGQIVNPVLS